MLNIAMAVFFELLGAAIALFAARVKFDREFDILVRTRQAAIWKRIELENKISELESELKKEREEHYLTKDN